MRIGISWAAVLGVVLFALMGPANAQATRTWVSGVGDDANPCSRTAPCKTFAGAISKTAAGGEISVLDPGGFGAVTITKSISIIQDSSGEAGILAAGTNGVIVNAGVNDVVILRGLVIDGALPALPGLNGIRFLAGAALHVEKCLVKNFVGAAPNGFGILFAPSSGTSELHVSDSTFINNGLLAGTTGAGIGIVPTGSGSANVTLNRVRLENNRIGFRSESNTTSGTLNSALFSSSAVGNSNNGIIAVTNGAGGTPSVIMVADTLIAANGTGMTSSGSGATIRIGNSVVSGNGTGVTAVSSGTLLSYKTNMIDGNTTNGTPITAIGANVSPAGTN